MQRLFFHLGTVAVIVVGLLSGCGVSDSPTSTPPIKPSGSGSSDQATLGQPFELAVEDTATVGDSGMTVRFVRVVNDSRCPKNTQCIQAGDAIIEVEVNDGTATASVEISIARDATPIANGQYAIRLLRLTPEPVGGQQRTEPYMATLFIEPAGATPTQGSQAPSDEQHQIVQTATYAGAIFPADLTVTYAPGTEAWTPTSADIEQLETGLSDYLKTAAAERSPELWQRLPSYIRQYAGTATDGHKQIAVNALCNTYDMNWQQQWIQVDDGGDCFFQTTYDVESQSFVNLSINGDA